MKSHLKPVLQVQVIRMLPSSMSKSFTAHLPAALLAYYLFTTMNTAFVRQFDANRLARVKTPKNESKC